MSTRCFLSGRSFILPPVLLPSAPEGEGWVGGWVERWGQYGWTEGMEGWREGGMTVWINCAVLLLQFTHSSAADSRAKLSVPTQRPPSLTPPTPTHPPTHPPTHSPLHLPLSLFLITLCPQTLVGFQNLVNLEPWTSHGRVMESKINVCALTNDAAINKYSHFVLSSASGALYRTNSVTS